MKIFLNCYFLDRKKNETFVLTHKNTKCFLSFSDAFKCLLNVLPILFVRETLRGIQNGQTNFSCPAIFVLSHNIFYKVYAHSKHKKEAIGAKIEKIWKLRKEKLLSNTL